MYRPPLHVISALRSIELTLLLKAVLQTVARLEDSQLERVVDHAGQRGAEQLGVLGCCKLVHVQTQALKPGRVNGLIGRVKANAGTVSTKRSDAVTFRYLALSKRAVLHVTGVIVPGQTLAR